VSRWRRVDARFAIAPPHALVRARSSPSSRSTARYWGANASFTSTRFHLLEFHLGLVERLPGCRCRTDAHVLRLDAGDGPCTRRPSGFNPCAFAYSSLAMTVAAPPSEMPEAFQPLPARPS